MAGQKHTTFIQLAFPFASEPKEQWRPVYGYEGLYEVSNMGRVRSIDRAHASVAKHARPGARYFQKGQILRTFANKPGYLRRYLKVGLYSGHGRQPKLKSVHHLVMEAFVCPRPEGLVCNHINGIPYDNRLENLEWVTPKRNTHHAMELGLSRRKGEDSVFAKHTTAEVLAIRKLYANGMSIAEIGRQTQTNTGTIHNIVHRRSWKHLPEE